MEIKVHLFLRDTAWLIKQPLCKGMILPLNPLILLFPDIDIEWLRSQLTSTGSLLDILFKVDWRPLSLRNIDQFVQQYLVISIEYHVFLLHIKLIVFGHNQFFIDQTHLHFFGFLLDVVNFLQLLELLKVIIVANFFVQFVVEIFIHIHRGLHRW